MSPAAGVRALAAVHASGASQVGVMIADWPRVVAAFPGGRSPLLSSMADDAEGRAPRAVEQAASPAGSKLVELLSEAPLEARHDLALDYLRGCIAGVLGIDASVLGDQDEPLADAGIDSLRAVEVRNLLKVAFARPFPSTLLFEHPTLDALARFLVDALITPVAREDGHAPASIPPSLPSPVAASVPPPSSAVAPGAGARPRFSELRDRVERVSHDEAAFVLSTRRSR
jgi:acyl carrier protein